MDCLVLPVSIFRKCYTGSRLGYHPLTEEESGEMDRGPVTVVVGKEQREFLVDPYVLEESPFRVLMETAAKRRRSSVKDRGGRLVVFLDVDAILFEHLLWLMKNDCSSLLQIGDLREIIDFYSYDY